MRIRLKNQTIIKEAFDNLPSGICYFNERGIPLLVNNVMHRLIFAITKRDLQNISDFDFMMQDSSSVFLVDGITWHFQKRLIRGKYEITEITAIDVTELNQKKQDLEKSNKELEDIIHCFEKAGQNIVSITRNEEILEMKMRIHNELAYALGITRQFITTGCPRAKKDEYIAEQKKITKMLLGEIDNNDEPDLFPELKQTAEKLGTNIILTGEIPGFAEAIMTAAVRECLINTIRHANGDTVYVNTDYNDENYVAVITDNGKITNDKIIEGGGLSSLRKNIEKNNGIMHIDSAPGFSMTITLPAPERRRKDND